MYHKVVVPLDGSKLAEIALPHLEEIAKGCHIAEVLLVSVTEKLRGNVPSGQVTEPAFKEASNVSSQPQVVVYSPGIMVGNNAATIPHTEVPLGKMAKTASNYLHRVAQDLSEKGFMVAPSVVMGNPAEEIIHFAEDQSADLIIMASRGKSSLNRWNMSNIAEKVIRGTDIPVLLVKPKAGFKETKAKRRGVAT
jgi:nucleotide-binding universal stress UspA family protein